MSQKWNISFLRPKYNRGTIEVLHEHIVNSSGIEDIFIEHLSSGEIDKAISLFENRDESVREAIEEYNPNLHNDVLSRPNKIRDGKETYISEKLPRALQKHINESEIYFLLNRPVEFRNDTVEGNVEANEKAFEAFNALLKRTRFHTNMREAKRLAGAETESAKYYRVFTNKEGKLDVNCQVLSAGKGYRLRPLFDEYGSLIAFGWLYKVKDVDNNIRDRFEVETPLYHYVFTKGARSWNAEIENNVTGKINVIYYRQDKAWAGVERRIIRLEMLDSKIADISNFFSAPKLILPTDLTYSLPDSPLLSGAGEVIEAQGDYNMAQGIRYLELPTAPEIIKMEIDNLTTTILLDTNTPPLNFDKLVGLGTLYAEAIQRAMISGYIKRNMLREIYDIAMEREISVLKNILPLVSDVTPDVANSLIIDFDFAEPMPSDDLQKMSTIGDLYYKKAISEETVVAQLNLYDNYDLEVERLKGTALDNADREIQQTN